MITVKATREGLKGRKTATGWLINTTVPFVALPATAALRQWVRLYNPSNNKTCRALVLDVGPWNIDDDAYVFQPATLEKIGLPLAAPGTPEVSIPVVRPLAEQGINVSHNAHTNYAGIDLGEAVWGALGLPPDGGSADICWEFC